ncbi:pupal cuticle protein C1B-like [Calliphora vicina]|uniref:pupal cuticle protein C1B-like n=1 Tax=Calliphora vicina TaxID=7373 RepID=UPI00325A7C68
MAFKFVVLSALLAVASAGYLAPVPTHYAAAPAVYAKVANPAVDAVASTHQNVVRSFDGTVSQYSKSVQTPYSSVHKEDTRVNNNVYTPTVAKTVTYAAPVVAKTVSYAPAPTASAVYTTHSAPVYAHQEPAHAVYASSAPHTVYTHEQPAHAVYATTAPHTVYTHEQPAHAVYASSAPHTVYTHEQPAHAVYASPAPTAAVYTHQHEAPSAATTTYNHGPAATTYTHNSPGVSAYGSSQTVHYSPAEMVSHMSFDGFGTHWGF